MSRITVHLRLRGDLPPSDDLTSALQGAPFKLRRRGQKLGKGRVQPTDVLSLELATWDDDGTDLHASAANEQLDKAAALLREQAPYLATLDRSDCHAELYVSTIRQEDQGGFELPAELIAAAGVAGLSLGVSILVMLDNYAPDESAGP